MTSALRFAGWCVAVLVVAVASSASGATATVATTSGAILTDVGGRIVVANADGSGAHALTHPDPLKSTGDESPVPSPDGSLIVFTREGFRGSLPIATAMLMRSDGSILSRIAEVPGGRDGEEVQWSPDGKMVALDAVDPSRGRANILLVSANGTGRRFLFPRSEEGSSDFTWSPDGSSIAYTNSGGIAIMDVGTGVADQIAAADNPDTPAWSPDGSRIAFATSDRVFLVTPDGRGKHAVGPAPEPGTGGLTWSPDGTLLAFTAAGDYPKPDFVVAVDVSTGRVTLTIPLLHGGGSAAPSWSPDGERLAFLRSREPDGYAEIDGDVWIVRRDGSQPVQITSAFPFGGSHSTPEWVPSTLTVEPDPPIATAAVRPARSQPLPHHYVVAAVDGASVAFVAGPGNPDGTGRAQALGVWRGTGPVHWIAGYADRVALAGSRVYWSWYGSDRESSASELWTVASTGARAVRLAHLEGKSGGPALMVAGDSSLTVYSLRGTLWRLRGTGATPIRQERAKFLEPLSVNNGRVLLYNGHALEVVDRNGKVLATLPPGKDPVATSLDGERVVLLDKGKVYVYRLPRNKPIATWPVGPPGNASRAGVPYGSLFPYQTANGYSDASFRLLNVATGRDVVLSLPNGATPTSVGITSTGLFYIAQPPYSGLRGQVGLVPLSALRTSLAQSAR